MLVELSYSDDKLSFAIGILSDEIKTLKLDI